MADRPVLGDGLACPTCGGSLQVSEGLECSPCRRSYSVVSGRLPVFAATSPDELLDDGMSFGRALEVAEEMFAAGDRRSALDAYFDVLAQQGGDNDGRRLAAQSMVVPEHSAATDGLSLAFDATNRAMPPLAIAVEIGTGFGFGIATWRHLHRDHPVIGCGLAIACDAHPALAAAAQLLFDELDLARTVAVVASPGTLPVAPRTVTYLVVTGPHRLVPGNRVDGAMLEILARPSAAYFAVPARSKERASRSAYAAGFDRESLADWLLDSFTDHACTLVERMLPQQLDLPEGGAARSGGASPAYYECVVEANVLAPEEVGRALLVASLDGAITLRECSRGGAWWWLRRPVGDA